MVDTIIFIDFRLEGLFIVSPPDGGAEVGGAEGEPAQPLALGELDEVLHGADAGHQPRVDLGSGDVTSSPLELQTKIHTKACNHGEGRGLSRYGIGTLMQRSRIGNFKILLA